MTIFKYELKRHKKYILGWAITLAVFILMMTPAYYSFMDVSQNRTPEKKSSGQRQEQFLWGS